MGGPSIQAKSPFYDQHIKLLGNLKESEHWRSEIVPKDSSPIKLLKMLGITPKAVGGSEQFKKIVAGVLLYNDIQDPQNVQAGSTIYLPKNLEILFKAPWTKAITQFDQNQDVYQVVNTDIIRYNLSRNEPTNAVHKQQAALLAKILKSDNGASFAKRTSPQTTSSIEIGDAKIISALQVKDSQKFVENSAENLMRTLNSTDNNAGPKGAAKELITIAGHNPTLAGNIARQALSLSVPNQNFATFLSAIKNDGQINYSKFCAAFIGNDPTTAAATTMSTFRRLNVLAFPQKQEMFNEITLALMQTQIPPHINVGLVKRLGLALRNCGNETASAAIHFVAETQPELAGRLASWTVDNDWNSIPDKVRSTDYDADDYLGTFADLVTIPQFAKGFAYNDYESITQALITDGYASPKDKQVYVDLTTTLLNQKDETPTLVKKKQIEQIIAAMASHKDVGELLLKKLNLQNQADITNMFRDEIYKPLVDFLIANYTQQ